MPEKGVLKERERKKEEIFEHLTPCEKNNDFSCLKTPTFVPRVWIIENVSKENVFQTWAELLHGSPAVLHTQTHNPLPGTTTLYPFPPICTYSPQGSAAVLIAA